MPFDQNQFEDDAMNDPGALITAFIVLGILGAIILAVLWRDAGRAEIDRVIAPAVRVESR